MKREPVRMAPTPVILRPPILRATPSSFAKAKDPPATPRQPAPWILDLGFGFLRRPNSCIHAVVRRG